MEPMDTQTNLEALRVAESNKVDRVTWTRWYSWGVAVVGIVIMLIALARPPSDLWGLALFALLAILAELNSVELFFSSRFSTVSVSSIIATASILALGPTAGALTYMVSGLVTVLTTSLSHERPKGGRVPWQQRLAFNTGMFVIAAALAGWVYVQSGGTPGQVARLANIIPIALAVCAEVFINLGILITMIALQTGRRPLRIWVEDFQWTMPITILGGLLGSTMLALAYEMFNVLGVMVFLLPVIATAYSFRLYTQHMKVYVNQLESVNQRLEDANVGLLETLGAVIDAYDVYTYGHSRQVAIYAGALAEKMNLPAEMQTMIVKAALVHDIGKIGIMDSIISKPGRLTDEEYAILKRHPIIGAEIVGRMKGLQELVPLVRGHHERWDGKGYPDGISAENIPLGARILAVADSIDALLSDRPYRPTRSFKEVKEEIIRCAGSMYDPMVVKSFARLSEDQPEGFFKNSAATVDRTVLMQGLGNIGQEVRYLKKSMLAGAGNR